MNLALQTMPRPPSSATVAAAEHALRALTLPTAATQGPTQRSISVRSQADDGEVSVVVPAEAFELFLAVLAQLANGNAVTVVPVHAEFTTQQAAEMLGVSRPYLVKLLDEGKIPHRMVGTHRRVLAADLLAYKTADDATRKLVVDELTAEAEKLGLGY